MNLGFLVERNNYFRIFGPVINTALKRGHQVFCFHDYSQPQGGSKGYQFPSIAQAPKFFAGQPISIDFSSTENLIEKAVKNNISVFVSLDFPARYLPLKKEMRAKGIFWASLQNGFDTGIISADNLNEPDKFFFYSQEWVDLLFAPEQALLGNIVPAGFWLCEKDSLLAQKEIKNKWRIPLDKKIVLFLPFPFGSSLKKFWARYVYGTRFFSQENDFRLTKAIKKFCYNNNAVLLVKCRKKDPPKRYLEKMADKVLYDESFYPATILECLSIADICFDFYSTVAIEAVSMGVPNVCIAPAVKDWADIQIPLWQAILSKAKDFFDSPGASYLKTIPEIINTLPKQTLENFPPSKEKQTLYIKKFANANISEASLNIIIEIEKLAKKE